MKFFFTLAFLFATTQLFSQTIRSIQYDGLIHLSKDVALRMLTFEVGDDIDEEMLDQAIKKYYRQGYFNDISAEIDENGVLTFYFVEKPVISKVELIGWKENDETVQDTVIQLKKGTIYSERKVEDAKKRIIEAISQDGKIDSVVEIQKEYLDNGSVKITFLVNEGEEIIINRLQYSGVKGLDPKEFDSVIANKEHEWMGWFWGRNDGELHLADLEYDNLRIRDFYMQNGYLDAQVNRPFVRVDFNNYSADMSYQIVEGQQYKISSISIEESKDVIAVDILKEKIKLKKGEVFNIKTFREDAQKIKVAIADRSYAYVQVVPDLKKNYKKQTVDVIYRVNVGEKVKIRNVIISGNNRTLDRIIRRELYLGPGDMYSLTDLKDSRSALGRLGFFESTTIEEKRVDANTMDLIVKVKEAPTGNIQLGGGYGSYGGFMLSLGVEDRNIWGSGINVGVKGEKSEMAKSASFNISNPRLNDSDFSGNFSIFSSDRKYEGYEDSDDYTVYTEGVSVGVGHKFSRHVSGYLSYGYTKNRYDFSEDTITYIDRYYYEDYTKSGVTLRLKFDNTDDYYLPREGFVITQSFEKTGLGQDANYFKSRSGFSTYYGLKEYVDFDAIFRYKAKYNKVFDNGYIPIVERFYAGGIGSIRGYRAYSLSPTIIDTDGDEKKTGALQSFTNSIELSLPLVPKAKMRVVTYLDWGFIGDERLDEISRGGYGAGIEWFSPVGPIQLMFSNPLRNQHGDRIAHFEFTMGQRF